MQPAARLLSICEAKPMVRPRLRKIARLRQKLLNPDDILFASEM
jgi:hypothetical protein